MKKFAFGLLLGTIFMVFMAGAAMAAEKDSSTVIEKATTVEKKIKKKASTAKADLLDINTATAEQLKAMPGITDEDALKIIAGRPYARKNQLKQKSIISASTYEGIKAKIVAKKVAKK
jgi:competence protein ComEA